MILDLFDSASNGLCIDNTSTTMNASKTCSLTSIDNRIFFWFSTCSGPSCRTRTIFAKTGSDLARMNLAASSRLVSAAPSTNDQPYSHANGARERTLEHETLQLGCLPLLSKGDAHERAHSRLNLLRQLAKSS
jgi:hypothetical protein